MELIVARPEQATAEVSFVRFCCCGCRSFDGEEESEIIEGEEERVLLCLLIF
jgi:hypothetical protein